MADPVYKLVDLVGTSDESVTDAIQNAITRASSTIRTFGGSRWSRFGATCRPGRSGTTK